MTVYINGTTGYNGPISSVGSISSSGSLTFTGTGALIAGDFSNATLLSRTSFQTTTTNGSTGIYALPNGTSTAASWQATNAADPTNASKILIATNGSTDVQLVSGRNGTGTYLPLTFYTNGSEQMRLDTSGQLGIGITSPTQKLEVAGTSSATAIRVSTTGGAAAFYEASAQTGAVVARLQANVDGAWSGTLTNSYYFFQINGAEKMRLDTSGNLGLGVTPSAWNSAWKFLQFPAGVAFGTDGGNLHASQNVYSNSGGTDTYIATGAATRYKQGSGAHYWYYAGSGTGGTTATFTQAMTLDASGNWSLGSAGSHFFNVTNSGTGNSSKLTGTFGGNAEGYSTSTGSTRQPYLPPGTQMSLVALPNSTANGAFLIDINAYGSANSASDIYFGCVNDTNSGSYTGTFVLGRRTGAQSWAESFRVDTSGNLLVGRTTTVSLGSNSAYFQSGVAVTDGSTTSRLGPDRIVFGGGQFYVLNGSSVGVRLDSGSTSWSSQSDETIKEIIEPITNAISKVASMRAVIGKYKTDEEGIRRSFLLAQDVQAVLPEAVSADDDGILSLRYTETIPLLVAAIKELKTDFDTYKLTHP